MLSKTDGLLFLVSRWLAESKEGIVTQDANGITMRNVTIHCDKDHLASNSNRNMPWIISFDEGQVFIKVSGGPLLRYPAYQCRTSAGKKEVESWARVSRQKTVLTNSLCKNVR